MGCTRTKICHRSWIRSFHGRTVSAWHEAVTLAPRQVAATVSDGTGGAAIQPVSSPAEVNAPDAFLRNFPERKKAHRPIAADCTMDFCNEAIKPNRDLPGSQLTEEQHYE